MSSLDHATLHGTRGATAQFSPAAMAFSPVTTVVLLALAVLQQSLGHHNGDNSWLFTVSERLLAGARPYVDVIETNPPGAFVIYLPAAWLAGLTHLRTEFVASAMIFVTTLALLRHLRHDLLQAGLLDRRNSVLFVNAGVFTLLLLPGFSFGEREHLAVICVLPLLTVYAMRAAGKPPGTASLIVAGLLAGVAVIAKPHFGAAIALPLAWLLWQRRSLWPLLAAEHAIAALPVALYLASLPLFFPAFFDVLPSILDVYVPIRTPPGILFTKPWFLTHLALVCALVAAGRRTPFPPLAQLCLLGSTGFLIAYVVQAKGWVNHGLPGICLAFLAAAFATAPALREIDSPARDGACWRALRRPVLFILLPAVLGAPILFGTIIQFTGWEEYEGLGAAVRRLAPPHPKLAVVSAELDVGHPLVRRVDGIWTMRPHSLWQMSCALMLQQRGDADPGLAQRLSDYVESDARHFREDVEENRPDLVIVDSSGAIGPILRHPQIIAALAPYAPVETLGHLTLWTRRP